MHYTDKEVLQKALEAHQAMREWIDAVPDDTVLPAMPGCDRDWLDTVEANLKQAIAAPVQGPVNGDKVKQLVSKCTHRDVDGNWYVDGVQLVHETCFALDAIKRKSTTPPAAQSAMRRVGVVEPLMGTMRTVIWDEGMIPSAGTTLWAKDE